MKVLIISHNSFSTHQSMGKTFLSLFSAFRKEELCQLYVYPTIPDVDICNSYYRITDKEILRSLYRFTKPGREILDSEILLDKHELFENPEDKNLYRKNGNDKAMKRLLRDVIWKMSRWYTGGLKTWIERENPTCIFLAPGYAKFIYDIAYVIAREYHLPIITYICDDYYFVQTPDTFIGKIQLQLLKTKIDFIMKNTDHLISINNSIEKLYSNRFDIEATTVMTGTNYDIRNELFSSVHPTRISYFGNVGCNRYLSLIEIGHVLDELNINDGYDFVLEIYTGEKNPQILKQFSSIQSIKIKDFISGVEFDETMHSTDLLVHIEAFDEASIDIVKNSISTKIADCLGSGIPLFAYGPDCVASINYLLENECSFVATSKNQIKELLLKALNDECARSIVVKKALEKAKENHDSAKNSLKLKKIITNMSEGF